MRNIAGNRQGGVVMTKALGTAALLAWIALGADCGSSATSASSPPADSTTIVSLGEGELGAFCAELASVEGGYSKTHDLSCDSGTSSVSFQIGTDQASCETQFKALPASCATLTVGQLKSCVTDTYASTCDTNDAAIPSCDPFFTCALGASGG
jgi:hypothetical protein